MLRSIILTASLVSCLFGSNTASTDYQIGMEYLNGERGVTMITRTMPNCPYERCADIVNKDGTHTFNFAKKDYTSAVKNLYKSATQMHNPQAAKELLNFLQRRLNWKEPKSDNYLIAKMQEDIAIDLPTYKKIFKDSVNILVEHKACEGYAIAGDIAIGGCLGDPYNLTKAISMYSKAAEVCPKDSYIGMTTSQKLKEALNGR